MKREIALILMAALNYKTINELELEINNKNLPVGF
jgi:hypothetical protein